MFPSVQDPRESLRDESFLQSLPQSGLKLIPQGHDDYGRVIVAASFIRHQDKAIGYGGEILRFAENAKNVVLVNRTGKSV